MQINDMSDRAVEIFNKYQQLNQKNQAKQWSGQDVMAGFVGDVGDLSKIVMAKHGLRPMDDIDAKLAHELSDCLWSVLVLAYQYDIDLASEFTTTLDQLEVKIDASLSESN